MKYYRTRGYVTDTWRKDRLTLNLGARIDSGSGHNEASSIPPPGGFDVFISGVDFAGNDRTKVWTDISPFGYPTSFAGKMPAIPNADRMSDAHLCVVQSEIIDEKKVFKSVWR